MKKLFATIVILAVSIFNFAAYPINFNKEDIKHLPLVSFNITNDNNFIKINNNTVVDIEFTQSTNKKIQLLCPQEYKQYLVITVEKNSLNVRLVKDLSNKERNTINKHLQYSKLIVSAPQLEDISINGSSAFKMMSNLNAKKLDITLNGSGDIVMQSVNSHTSINACINGSGDIKFIGEAKSNDFNCNLNGSGDFEFTNITSRTTKTCLNGSGDISFIQLATINAIFNVNGSGDIKAKNIFTGTTSASVTGSGDISLKGKCDDASYQVTSSGTIEATKLEATNVTAALTGSGDIRCNAKAKLTAGTTGSGCIEYYGKPAIKTASKKTNIKSLN